MKLKETTQKRTLSSIKESVLKPLDVSFTKIIKDCDFGLLPSSHDHINNKTKIQKIVKTIMFIREKKPHELIQTPKEQQIGEVFGSTKQNVSYHISNILSEGELEHSSVKEFLTVRTEGTKIGIKQSRILATLQ